MIKGKYNFNKVEIWQRELKLSENQVKWDKLKLGD